MRRRLTLAGGDERIDDDLRALQTHTVTGRSKSRDRRTDIEEVAELGFPDSQAMGTLNRHTVFEP